MSKETNKTTQTTTQQPKGILTNSLQPTSGITTSPPTNQSSSSSGNSKGKK